MMTSKDFAVFLVALLNGAPEEPLDHDDTAGRHVAGPSLDPAERLPASD